MDGVGTPIIGRPRPLPGHDTPNPAYHPHTLNYEEPLFFTIGYLIGGVVSSGQLAANLSTLIQLLALFLSGAAIPFAILPDSLAAVLSKIPTSLFADLIFWAADSPLQRTSNPLLAFAVVIAVTVALFVVAVRAFKWDVRK